MNIFILSKDPQKAAHYLCDKHVVKMVLESAQMLCSAFPSGDAPYKRAYYNHPCTKWARESQQNYRWLLGHAAALCIEYSLRYGKCHKSWDAIQWCNNNHDKLGLPNVGLTEFAQAMPDEYKQPCPVSAYRAYYNGDKHSFAKWRLGNVPDWFSPAPLVTN